MLKSKFKLIVALVVIFTCLFSITVGAEEITIQWWDWADSIENFTNEIFENYEEKNPEINIDYGLHSASRFSEMISLAVRSGDAPDVHGVRGLEPVEAVANNWFEPLDKYIDEIYPGGTEAWKSNFAAGSFAEGLNMFDGKVYSFPRQIQTGTPNGNLLFYNKELFKKAGLDPERPPKTWGEFREYAKKITKAGDGDYYGIIMGGKQIPRWQYVVSGLAKVAGGPGSVVPKTLIGFDYRTGEYKYENENFIEALDLLKSMKEDGSFYPGFLGLNAPDARARFGIGEAGFIIQGKWSISTWKKENPELDLGIAFLPVPDKGRKGYIAKVPAATHGWEWALSESSNNPKEAVKLMLYRTSKEVAIKYNQTGDGLAPFTDIISKDNTAKTQYKLYKLAEEQTKIIPIPQFKNPETSKVLGNMKTVRPNLAEIIQGAFLGQLDYVDYAKKLSQKMNKELNKTITDLKSEGVEVSRSDFIFEDWDPMKDYIIE